jgi:hypothetical protein
MLARWTSNKRTIYCRASVASKQSKCSFSFTYKQLPATAKCAREPPFSLIFHLATCENLCGVASST